MLHIGWHILGLRYVHVFSDQGRHLEAGMCFQAEGQNGYD